MTRDEILALNPGRKLDRLVIKMLEKVTGRNIFTHDFMPSRDARGGYAVILNFKESGIFATVRSEPDGFRCQINGGEWVLSQNMQHAICLAALLAINGGE